MRETGKTWEPWETWETWEDVGDMGDVGDGEVGEEREFGSQETRKKQAGAVGLGSGLRASGSQRAREVGGGRGWRRFEVTSRR